MLQRPTWCRKEWLCTCGRFSCPTESISGWGAPVMQNLTLNQFSDIKWFNHSHHQALSLVGHGYTVMNSGHESCQLLRKISMPYASSYSSTDFKQIPISQGWKRLLAVPSKPSGCRFRHRVLPVRIYPSPIWQGPGNCSWSRDGTDAFVHWAFSTVATKPICLRWGYHRVHKRKIVSIDFLLNDIWVVSVVGLCPCQDLPEGVQKYHGSIWFKLDQLTKQSQLFTCGFTLVSFWGPSAQCLPQPWNLTAAWLSTPTGVAKLHVRWVVQRYPGF